MLPDNSGSTFGNVDEWGGGEGRTGPLCSASRCHQFFFGAGLTKEDTRPVEVIVREKLLTLLESAYPNVLAVEDLTRW